RGRARLLTEPLRAGGPHPLQPDGINEPDESVGAFARRRLGDGVAERLVDPLVCGVYGGDMDRLSLSATAPQLAAQIRAGQSALRSMLHMSGSRKRVTRDGARPSGPPRQLVSFAGGIGELTEALAGS